MLPALRLLPRQDLGYTTCRERQPTPYTPKFQPHTRQVPTMAWGRLWLHPLQHTCSLQVSTCYRTRTSQSDYSQPKITLLEPFPSHPYLKCHHHVLNVVTPEELHVTAPTARKRKDWVLLELTYEKRTFTVVTSLVVEKFTARHLI